MESKLAVLLIDSGLICWKIPDVFFQKFQIKVLSMKEPNMLTMLCQFIKVIKEVSYCVVQPSET